MVTQLVRLNELFDVDYRKAFDAQKFNELFKIVYAYHLDDTGLHLVKDADKEYESFKLRYLAYCEEHDYEPKNGGGIERDQFDDFAFVALIQHKPSGKYLASVRLIPKVNKYDELQTDLVCGQMVPQVDYSQSRVFEISRFCLSHMQIKQVGLSKEDSSYIFPSIVASAYLMSKDMQASHWYGCMAPGLIKKLERQYNVYMDWYGKPFVHQGKRQPFISHFDSIERMIFAGVSKQSYLLREIIALNICDQPGVNACITEPLVF